jgi:probable HAF family extracellular repeat protein
VSLGAFDNPGGLQSSQARAVSADGSVIVGGSALPHSLNEDGSPFRWTAQTGLVFLGSLGGTDGGVANGVSADGSVVAGYGSDASFNLEAFRWTQGTGAVAIGDVSGGPVNSQARGVSGDGSIVVGYGSHVFVFDTGFRWTSGTGLTTPFPTRFQALGISQDGQVVVGAALGRAVVVGPGGPITIPRDNTLGGTDSAFAASADGSVVVGLMALDQNGGDFGHAFIWDAQHGTRFLIDVLADLGFHPQWVLNAATGISADGRVICGYGFDPLGEQAGWVIHLPGPCGSADFNCDGDIGTDADIEAFFACISGSCPAPPCTGSADFNGDGDVGTDADIEAFFRVLAGGSC